MKKLCLIIYTLSLLIPGCTHIHKYSTFDELNSKTKGKEAKITLINEQELIGKDIYISSDSTFWIDPDRENKKSIITPEVSSIFIKDRTRGAIAGLGLGLLGGAAVGCLYRGWFWPIVNAITTGIGGLLGFSYGLIVGVNDKFIINPKGKYSYNFELSTPITPNSIIKLEISPHDALSIQKILEHELSLKGLNVVSEGQADHVIYFSYSINKQQKLIGFTANIVNSSTGRIAGFADFQNVPYREIIITEIIKEFVNQLCKDMK